MVTATAWMSAAPARVYGLIADYRNGHPKILPREFRQLTVEQGGVGEGTIIAFAMQVFGRLRRSRAAITEPEPGRVLVETALDGSGVVTTFTVNAARGGSEVTISTVLPNTNWVERKVAAWFLRGVYRKELALLADCAGRTIKKPDPVRGPAGNESVPPLEVQP